ncbi:MAG: hypothetical protein K0U64_02760 [Actinomycetia bacterium]|nr:hypothetical protein [Actinomycetes bacterium]
MALLVSDRYRFIISADSFGDWIGITTSDPYLDLGAALTPDSPGPNVLRRFPEYNEYERFSLSGDGAEWGAAGPVPGESEVALFLDRIGWSVTDA